MSGLRTSIPKLLQGRSSLLFLRNSSNTASKLVYSEHGDPVKVLEAQTEAIAEPKDADVVLRMLAAPVNPADINMIQGKYPVPHPLPHVGGNEGVGEVVKVGPLVRDLQLGDHVVPTINALGTWRTHLTAPENLLLKVPKELGLVEAATLTVNPCTAYRMLKDFATLKPGDTIIQNGSNSACGQNVIQICKAWGLNSVNIVRDRAGLDDLRGFLKTLGATEVLTEEELRKTDLFRSKKLEKPKLALNCVGGQSALELLRHLQHGGSMVTYGGMSREPVTVPTSALIFKNIKVLGFWMTTWSHQNANTEERTKMFNEIIDLMITKKLQGPSYKLVNFAQYREAVLNTMTIKGMTGKKYILGFDAN